MSSTPVHRHDFDCSYVEDTLIRCPQQGQFDEEDRGAKGSGFRPVAEM